MPEMGMVDSKNRVSEAAALYERANLADALFSRTQQRVLACVFGQLDRSCSVTELIAATGAGSGAVQRELARLAGSGILSVEKVGNQKRYRANPQSPVHDELASIVRKTFGLVGPLREALQPLEARIRAAFVYGSAAKGQDTASSDIDVLIVADDLSYAEAMTVLHPLDESLGRTVNPTIYTPSELRKRIDSGSSFVTRVWQQPRLWLIGSDDDLAA